MKYSEFGIRARVIMLQKGITITKLAEVIGVTPSYVSETLKGTRNSEEMTIKIAQFLEMDTDIGGEPYENRDLAGS